VSGGGWAAIPNSVSRSGLGANALAVLVVVSGHVGSRGYMLSHALIASEVGCSIMSVRRAISELQKRGLLDVQPTFHGRAQGSNCYRVTFDLSVSVGDGLFTENTPPVLDEQGSVLSEQAEEEPKKKNQYGARRASAPPDDFTITTAMRAWWAAKDRRDIDLAQETERFLDYHRSKGNTFKDWTAAWRTWMSKASTERTHHSGTVRAVRNPV